MIDLTIEVRGNVVILTSDLYEPVHVMHPKGVCWGDIMDDVELYAGDVIDYLSDMTKYCDYCHDCEVCDDFDNYEGTVVNHVDVVTVESGYYVLTTHIY